MDARTVQADTLYRCHNSLLPSKAECFTHLKQRWSELFDARYERVVYDLTRTYLV